MNQLESKSRKYLLLLLALYFIKNLITAITPLAFHPLGIELSSKAYYNYFKINHYLLNFVFSVLMYYDYKKENKSKLLIPLLAFLNPIVGTIFYFILTFLISSKKIES